MRISLIAAMAANRVIGRDGGLPWHLPADLRFFKRTTQGHTLVMGRKTFESIGRPLPGRSTIVITRQRGYAPEGVQVAHSLEEALRLAAQGASLREEVFIGGGEELFRETLPIADRLYLTRIEQDFPGDTRFPELDESRWHLVQEERHEAGSEAPFAFTFQTFERRPSGEAG